MNPNLRIGVYTQISIRLESMNPIHNLGFRPATLISGLGSRNR